MNNKLKILAFAGSAREGSFNKKLIKVAVGGARKAGADVTLIDLADYRFPLYDGDLESKEGLPGKAKELKKMMMEHDGFLIASPEYNSSISGVLKNAIDWVSRPEKDDPISLCAFRGKSAALMSASPGHLGGLRGLVTLRSILENIYCLVVPEQVTISNAMEAFNEDGQFKDIAVEEKVLKHGKHFVDFLIKLKGK